MVGWKNVNVVAISGREEKNNGFDFALVVTKKEKVVQVEV